MDEIGIIGGGISSLHLGLQLLHEGIAATIFHPQSAEEIAHGRLMNSVVHQADTVRREDDLGISFWDTPDTRLSRGHDHGLNIPGMGQMRFWGAFEHYGRGIDYRLMLPRLMEAFAERGGTLEHRTLTASDLPALHDRFDLVAVGVGKTRAGFGDLFDEAPGLNSHDGPARVLCCGLFDGIEENVPGGVALGISPGVGELVVIPMRHVDGSAVYALLFENLPGGPTSVLVDFDRAADPDGFDRAVLEALETHFPHTYARVDHDAFGLHADRDLLQGSFRPVVRRAYAVPDGEHPVIAIGDVRVTVDPVTGAGANLASYGAWMLAKHIAAHDGRFDEAFAKRYEDAVMPRTEATVGFNDLVLDPPEYFVGLLLEMAGNQSLCDEFTDGFADPEHLWFDCVKDAETAAAFAASHQ
jgi:2-polyprenyl-6-methoxyphenol hydroxylase-like FAD-dependent oxidoreductase